MRRVAFCTIGVVAICVLGLAVAGSWRQPDGIPFEFLRPHKPLPARMAKEDKVPTRWYVFAEDFASFKKRAAAELKRRGYADVTPVAITNVYEFEQVDAKGLHKPRVEILEDGRFRLDKQGRPVFRYDPADEGWISVTVEGEPEGSIRIFDWLSF